MARRCPIKARFYLAHAFGTYVVVTFLTRNEQRTVGRHAFHLVIGEGIGGVRQSPRLAISRAKLRVIHVVSHA